MTYQDQRKILAYVQSHFEFRADRYYYFDLAKTDLEKSLIVHQVYDSEKDFDVRTRQSEQSLEFNILVFPDRKNEIMLCVNGDGFDYYENLTTGEIDYDLCAPGEIDLIQLKLEFLQLKRELNAEKDE